MWQTQESAKVIFCETCKQAICRDCTVLGHKETAGHVLIEIADAQVTYRQSLLGQINNGLISLTQIQRNLNELEREMAQLAASKKSTDDEIKKCMKHARNKLRSRENKLIKIAKKEFDAKQKTLLNKQKPLKESIDRLSENLNQAKKLVKNGTFCEVVETYQDLMNASNLHVLNFDFGKNFISCDLNKGMDAFMNRLGKLGEINTNGFLPAKFEFRCNEPKASQKADIYIELFNHIGEPIPVITRHFAATITDPHGAKLESVLNTAERECTVTFTPQLSGLHKVTVTFLGQQLTDEENQLYVSSNNPVLKFGQRGNGNGTFFSPCGIAIDYENVLYVADAGNRLIQKFTADGQFLSQFSVAAHDKACTTADVALDMNRGLILCIQASIKDGNVVGGEVILAFNLFGELQHKYTPGNISSARWIAINNHGELIIPNEDKKCLSKVDRAGDFLCHVVNLNSPGHIAIADDDSIIVPDTGRDCVHIFNHDGTVRHKFGCSGTGKGQLKQPFGVATDGEYILVGEVVNKRVQVFRRDGTFVSIIESREDPLLRPMGLAVTKDGHVYVVDQGNQCIKKYKYKDMPSQQVQWYLLSYWLNTHFSQLVYELITKIFWKLFTFSSLTKWINQVPIFHMSQQFSCRVMCKIGTWSNNCCSHKGEIHFCNILHYGFADWL